MRPFLLIALLCLVIFVAAGIAAGQLIPWWAEPGPSLRGGPSATGLSLWAIVQNASAVVGLVSFIIQIVQWGRALRP